MTEYHVGQVLTHDTWGAGTVTKISSEHNAEVLTLDFGAGIGAKRLLPRYAPLTTPEGTTYHPVAQEFEAFDHKVRDLAQEMRVREAAKALLAFERSTHRGSIADAVLNRDGLRDLPKPEPLIDGILDRHSYALLTGRDHTYKTFIALDWALCVATGKRWQGRHVERAKVLYVAAEGAYGINARIDAWEAAWRTEVDADWFHTLPRPTDLHTGAELDQLLEIVADKGLVVIDTLRRVSGRAEGNGSEMGTVVDNIDHLKRATGDGSILVIAHTDKGDNDARGFSGIEDDADIVWHSKRDDGSRFLITNTKMKNGPNGHTIPLLASTSHGSLIIEGIAPGTQKIDTSAARQAVLAYLQDYADAAGGFTPGQLIDNLNLPKTTVYRVLRELLESDLVTKDGRNRYTPRFPPPSWEIPTPIPTLSPPAEHDSHAVPPDSHADSQNSHHSHPP